MQEKNDKENFFLCSTGSYKRRQKTTQEKTILNQAVANANSSPVKTQ